MRTRMHSTITIVALIVIVGTGYYRQKRKSMEEDEVNKAIIDLCKEYNSRDELEGFFDSCKIRVRKMSPPIRSAVQHQISTI